MQGNSNASQLLFRPPPLFSFSIPLSLALYFSFSLSLSLFISLSLTHSWRLILQLVFIFIIHIPQIHLFFQATCLTPLIPLCELGQYYEDGLNSLNGEAAN
jgi:hypothetical protein